MRWWIIQEQISIKAVKVEEVICVLRRIIGQVLGVNHAVHRSGELWLLSKENLNISSTTDFEG